MASQAAANTTGSETAKVTASVPELSLRKSRSGRFGERAKGGRDAAHSFDRASHLANMSLPQPIAVRRTSGRGDAERSSARCVFSGLSCARSTKRR